MLVTPVMLNSFSSHSRYGMCRPASGLNEVLDRQERLESYTASGFFVDEWAGWMEVPPSFRSHAMAKTLNATFDKKR